MSTNAAPPTRAEHERVVSPIATANHIAIAVPDHKTPKAVDPQPIAGGPTKGTAPPDQFVKYRIVQR